MSRSHGVLPTDACSVLSLAFNEPLAGTAPHTVVWLAIEQSGPWGAKALVESHLPTDLGKEVDALIADHPIRPLLIRRPGSHIDPKTQSQELHERTLMVAFAGKGRDQQPWLMTAHVVGDAALREVLLGLNPSALIDGVPPGEPWQTDTSRVTLICTNGKRDTCCAISGRHLLDDVIDNLPQQDPAHRLVWECSHPGGHRFAPTVVLLPDGNVLGRAAVADVAMSLTGRLPVHALRGRSALTPAEQAAEIAVLHEWGPQGRTLNHGLVTMSESDQTWVTVQSPDGRTWIVDVREMASEHQRPVSCGKVDEPLTSWVTRIRKPAPIGQDSGRDQTTEFRSPSS